MSGEGGPLAATPAAFDVCADLAGSERHAIARRIGATVAAFQREASEGRVDVAMVELRLASLADDVRAGLHARDAGE